MRYLILSLVLVVTAGCNSFSKSKRTQGATFNGVCAPNEVNQAIRYEQANNTLGSLRFSQGQYRRLFDGRMEFVFNLSSNGNNVNQTQGFNSFNNAGSAQFRIAGHPPINTHVPVSLNCMMNNQNSGNGTVSFCGGSQANLRAGTVIFKQVPGVEGGSLEMEFRVIDQSGRQVNGTVGTCVNRN